MLTLRLPPRLEKRLQILAKKTRRSVNSHVHEAIRHHIEDLEEYHLANAAFPAADRALRSQHWRMSCDNHIFG